MVQSIEFASMQKTVFEALETGKDTLQKLNSQMSVADVELLMDESQEAIDRAMEIDELLSGKLTDEDEEAILAEFEVLQADVVEAGMKQLPTASTVTPPVTTDSTIVHTTVPMTVTGASMKTSTNTPIRNSPQKIEEKKGRKEKESPAMVLM